ncbi:uncharacterized protein LOC110456445 [Mizuhopecten yessoensis]|uniref:B30.2/SPRY domain-containing protein n=1 Tax=Mizuhopecten yessoensis TaxID=6573 RepID=A0A210QB06_MIZYE|nr:uncharacterized protein LOC110456445 [Mizuhopecten yessoensis]OWF45917.1 hypothetical protein KP79_PYT07313 [Mizuhopecten yessoensis]
MADLFRYAGDIVFDGHPPFPGQIMDVQLKQFSETSNFLQCTKALSPRYPYFFGQIRALSTKSKITIGIAGPNLGDDAHPGKWNRTVGYHSDTGNCYTCHSDIANSNGERFRIGDTFGVMITYFGQTMSTVMFVKNGKPVATRYHFETNHEDFLPTITLENGPIDMGIMWPEAAIGVPRFDDRNMLQWMHAKHIQYDIAKQIFTYNEPPGHPVEFATIQSPQPLETGFQHFEIIVQDMDTSGVCPAIGVATCSPMSPTPTCELLRDFFRWEADGKVLKVKSGSVVGIGVYYNPEEQKKPDFDCRSQQLVMVFLTFDKEVALAKHMIQPEGGFFPLVVLRSDCSKVKIDTQSHRTIPITEYQQYDDLYWETFEEAQDIIMEDTLRRVLRPFMFRKSDAIDIDIPEYNMHEVQPPDMSKLHCTIRLEAEHLGIHVVQFLVPMTTEMNHYYMEIKTLNEDSVVTIGLGDDQFPLKKHPGKVNNSTGWSSRGGLMYYNGSCLGHTLGERYEEGDTVELELRNIGHKWPVVLFSKNTKAVGTRHYTVLDPSQMLPTLSLCGNGYAVEVRVFWPLKIFKTGDTAVNRIKNWIMPSGSEVDEDNNIAMVSDHIEPIMLQSPYPFMPDKDFDFFEIELIDDFDAEHIPAGIAVSTPCFQELQLELSSIYRQDTVRFLAQQEALDAVTKGQKIGWGMIIPESEKDKEDKLVILYLCIDKSIAITRVMYLPQGGFYPFIILPPSVNRVKMTNTVHIAEHPITPQIQEELISQAKEVIAKEKEQLAQGKDPLDMEIEKTKLFKVWDDTKTETPSKIEPSRLAMVAMTATVIERKRAEIRNSKSCVIL